MTLPKKLFQTAATLACNSATATSLGQLVPANSRRRVSSLLAVNGGGGSCSLGDHQLPSDQQPLVTAVTRQLHRQSSNRSKRQAASNTLDRRNTSMALTSGETASTALCLNCSHLSNAPSFQLSQQQQQQHQSRHQLQQPPDSFVTELLSRSQHHLMSDDMMHQCTALAASGVGEGGATGHTSTIGRRRPASRSTSHRHQSYHHHHRHNSHHQRGDTVSHSSPSRALAASERHLLIDDAELLHQCLVSLAGEHNVNLLLKRFQQRGPVVTTTAAASSETGAPSSVAAKDSKLERNGGDDLDDREENAISPC